jgi:micrococcal nuclease
VPRKTNCLIRSLLASLVKTPGTKLPGVFLCLLFALVGVPLSVSAECGVASGTWVKVKRVSDGDTLQLHDGRAVRVLGINAPEIAHGKSPAQPFGRESRVQAQAFVDATQGRIRLGFEREIKDRYGRLLAHVYDARGRSLAAELLRTGMALQVAVPPNHGQAECFIPLEQEARKYKRGLWRSAYWQSLSTKSMRGNESGFRLVRGRILKVDINSAVWLEFEGSLMVKVARKDWPLFGYRASDWRALKGKEVEVRGWITLRQANTKQANPKQFISKQAKSLVMQLRSPSSLRVIK